ncbi:MAG TPA: hypothetical protein PLE12_07355 [Propionicimonas sp.]|jgi:hypothetical protein|nr:hypothetical protein [Propionicimonas sp.]
MDDTGWRDTAEHAGEAIERALGSDAPEAVVAALSEAGRALEEALREAMAAAVLSGLSMRRVAEITGLAPNSVPPRLARAKALQPYAAGGITAQDIAVARHDAASGRPPMTFKPRREEPR